jgi:hypothetical protein
MGRQHFINFNFFSQNIKMLLDTGSMINILPKKYIPESIKITPNDLKVLAYNNSSVPIYGFLETDLIIDGTNWGRARFYVSDNFSPILGSASIEDLEMTINLKRKRIINHGPIERIANICNIVNTNNITDLDQFDAISSQTFTFRPKSETIIDLEVVNLKSSLSLFFEESNLKNSKLEILPSFQHVSQNSPFFRVYVVNPTNNTIKIQKNTKFLTLFRIANVGKIQSSCNLQKILDIVEIGPVSKGIKEEFIELLRDFGHLFLSEGDYMPSCNIAEFSIDTLDSQPIVTAPYRTPFALRDNLKEILDNYVENGIIEPCISSWNSPSLLVKKKGGKWRLVIDYRKLNSSTHQYHHPLPLLEDSISYLEGSEIFSSCDLFKGFHQISVAPESRDKTAFSNEFGQFRFLRMPMGPRNSPSFFMKIMDTALTGVDKSEILAYMDDCCVHSKNERDHLANLRKFFHILNKFNLRVNIKKCSFFTRKLDFCGFEIEKGILRPSKDKIFAVQNLKIPETREQAQSIFGALSCHRKFIRDFADIAVPISSTYRGNFKWTADASEALDKLKKIICDKAMELTIPPMKGGKFVLESDASDRGYGGVLYLCFGEFSNSSHNHSPDCLRPVAYNSANFTDAQTRYTILEKELLACRNCIQKWSTFLSYRDFDVLTDNGNVKYALSMRTTNSKLQRWTTDIQSFSFKIIQKASAQMKISDCLSRVLPTQVKVDSLSIEISDLVELQKNDKILSEIRKFVRLDRWPRKPDTEIVPFVVLRDKLRILKTEELVLVDRESERLCVPKILQIEIIKEYHESFHIGIDLTFSRIARKYFWPKMRVSIADFIRSCLYCQTHKADNHPNVAPTKTFATPTGPFQKIGFDLIGPLKITDSGCVYVMTAVDFFSKKGYALALKSKESKYLLEKFKAILYHNPYFPKSVVMDNAPEFSEIKNYLKASNIEVCLAPARHPQTNGAAENFNRSFKSRLRACCENLENWDRSIHKVLHEINSSIHSVTKFSPFTVETGILNPHASYDAIRRNCSDRINVNFEEIKARIDQEKEARCKKFENSKFEQYEIGEKVLMKNFRGKYPPFIGPFTVFEKSETTYKLKENEKSGKRIFVRHANDVRKLRERNNESDLESAEIENKPKTETRIESFSKDSVQIPLTNFETIFPGEIGKAKEIKSSENVVDINLSISSDSDSDSSISEESVILNKSNREIRLMEELVDISVSMIERNIFLEFFDQLRKDLFLDSRNENSGLIAKPDISNLLLDELVGNAIDLIEGNIISEMINKSVSDVLTARNSVTTPQRKTYVKLKNLGAEMNKEAEILLNDNIEFPENTTIASESLNEQTCLDYITESSIDTTLDTTQACFSDRNLTDFEDLDLSKNSSKNENFNKRQRESSDESLPSEKKVREPFMDNQNDGKSDSSMMHVPERFLNAAKEWQLQNNSFDDMSIRLEFPNENTELFERIEQNYESFKANDLIEKGCVLKLKELPKDLLLFILYKFNQNFSAAENCVELRFRIKNFMDENHPNWRKTETNEYLFFGVLCLKKTKNIYEFSMPELKCLCAAYNLPKFRSTSKTVLVEFIVSQFEILYPSHPKDKNVLVFYPDTNL